jgi:hypothetical protein
MLDLGSSDMIQLLTATEVDDHVFMVAASTENYTNTYYTKSAGTQSAKKASVNKNIVKKRET